MADRDWHYYGVVVRRSSGREREPALCRACGQPCGHKFLSFDDSDSEQVTVFTVSDHHKCIAQHIDTEENARLIASAPQMYDFLCALRESDPILKDEDEEWRRCAFCRAEPDRIGDGPEFTPHRLDCLWRRAVEMVIPVPENP